MPPQGQPIPSSQAQAPRQGTGFLASNLRQLGDEGRRLAPLLWHLPPPEDIVLRRNELGLYNLERNGQLLLHPQNPAEEAREALRRSERARPETLLLYGIGLGYSMLASGELMLRQLVVIEPDLALLRFVLDTVDFSELLAMGRSVEIITDIPRLEARLPTLLPPGRRYASVGLPGLLADQPAFFAQVDRAISERQAEARGDVESLLARERCWTDNSFRNAEQLPGCRPIASLRGRLRGRAAVVVGGGPSLDAALPALRDIVHEERAVVIAAGQAARPLRHAGITPHFVVISESGPHAEQLQGLDAAALPRLVLDLAAHPDFFAAPCAERFCFASQINGLAITLLRATGGTEIADASALDVGGSVACAATSLAELMEAAEIVLVGVDLAFPEGRVYAAHSVGAQEATERVDAGDSEAAPEVGSAEVAAFVREKDLRWVEGQRGEQLPTYSHHISFKRWFESRFDALVATVRLWNASLGGARIQGWAECALADLKARWAPGSVGDALSALPAPAADGALRLSAIRRHEAEALREIAAIAERSALLWDAPEDEAASDAQDRELDIADESLRIALCQHRALELALQRPLVVYQRRMAVLRDRPDAASAAAGRHAVQDFYRAVAQVAVALATRFDASAPTLAHTEGPPIPAEEP